MMNEWYNRLTTIPITIKMYREVVCMMEEHWEEVLSQMKDRWSRSIDEYPHKSQMSWQFLVQRGSGWNVETRITRSSR